MHTVHPSLRQGERDASAGATADRSSWRQLPIIIRLRAIARVAFRAGSPRATRRLSQNDCATVAAGTNRNLPYEPPVPERKAGFATASTRKALILFDDRIDRSPLGALTMICRNSEKCSTKRNIMLQRLECIGSVLGDVPWVTRIMCLCAGAH